MSRTEGINFRIPRTLYNEAVRLKGEKGFKTMQDAFREIHCTYEKIKFKRVKL